MISKAIWKTLNNGSFDLSISQFSETRNILKTCPEKEVLIRSEMGEWMDLINKLQKAPWRKKHLNWVLHNSLDREQAKGILDRCNNYYKMCRHIEGVLNRLWCLNCTVAGDLDRMAEMLGGSWGRQERLCNWFLKSFSEICGKWSNLPHACGCPNLWESVRDQDSWTIY